MTKSRSNAVAPNAKGTLVVGNGTDASTTLAVASTAGYLLTVDSAETTGLKWSAPAGFTFTTWTPTWTGLTVGNGTVTARYGTNGKFTSFIMQLVFGSTTSITAGQPYFTLPTTPKTGNAQGNITFNDYQTDTLPGMGQISSNGNAYLAAIQTNATYATAAGMNTTIPFTWTTNDSVIMWGTYEEA